MMSEQLQTILQRALSSQRFGEVILKDGALRCRAKGAAAEAWFVITPNKSDWTISLLTGDRWLSESIEGDMLEGHDSVEELIDDELVEIGYPHRARPVKHYRDESKTYVFTSEIPLQGVPDIAEGIATYLLAFSAAFLQLGEMQGNSSE